MLSSEFLSIGSEHFATPLNAYTVEEDTELGLWLVKEMYVIEATEDQNGSIASEQLRRMSLEYFNDQRRAGDSSRNECKSVGHQS